MSDRVLIEMHAHTKESSCCGWLAGDELIEALASKKYGAVVITDHFIPGKRENEDARRAFLAGYHRAKEVGDARSIAVLPGMEIRFKDKREDFLVYGMEEEDIINLPDDVCEWNIKKFHSFANEKGWMVYQAHPFRSKLMPADPPEIDGMETFNGNPRHNSQNRLSSGFAMRHSLRTIAGSDIHRSSDVGIVGLLAPKEALTPKGMAAWLLGTPSPRVHYQEAPVDGIRYVTGAIPNRTMLEALYHDAGWTRYLDAMDKTMAGIRNSLRIVTAWDDTTLVGMARAVGDGQTILYIQDLLVLGTFQRRGIGRALMQRVIRPYLSVRQVVLLTDDIVETKKFYKACGFERISEIGCVGYIRLR
jgi:hypothetical protein